MTTKDTIIIFYHYPQQAKKESLTIQRLLIETCNKEGFNIVKTFECTTEEYLKQDKIRSFLARRGTKINVIINNLTSPPVYPYWDIFYPLNILSMMGAIDLYTMDKEGKLHKKEEGKNDE